MAKPVDYEYVYRPPVKLPSNLIHIPRCRQGTTWTCGVAVIQSLVRYYGGIEFDMREDTLIAHLKSNEDIGTGHLEMIKFLKEKGFEVTVREHLSVDDVKRSVIEKDPILVCFQAWVELKEGQTEIDWAPLWDDGHYAIIVGFDEERFFFMDPSTLGQYAYIPFPEFQKRWHDCDGVDNSLKLFQWGLTMRRSDRDRDDSLDTMAFYLG